jgi:hypothetical protein
VPRAPPDRKPSLSITVGGGGILWHCHAGCPDAAARAALVQQELPDL